MVWALQPAIILAGYRPCKRFPGARPGGFADSEYRCYVAESSGTDWVPRSRQLKRRLAVPRPRSGPGRRKLVEPRVKVWLEVDGQYVFGFGLSEILKAIETTGSIKAAARQLGKSYRYVWGRIKRAEEAIGQPLVRTRVGGKDPRRSSLTPRASQLVADYDALRNRMFEVVEQEFACRFRPPKRSRTTRS